VLLYHMSTKSCPKSRNLVNRFNVDKTDWTYSMKKYLWYILSYKVKSDSILICLCVTDLNIFRQNLGKPQKKLFSYFKMFRWPLSWGGGGRPQWPGHYKKNFFAAFLSHYYLCGWGNKFLISKGERNFTKKEIV